MEYNEIMDRVDKYNRRPGNPVSPFIARAQGHLGVVAKEIGVPVAELDAFLMKVDMEMPQDYLQ